MDINQILFHLQEPHEEWKDSIAPPIYQTSNFKLKSIDDFKNKIKDDFKHHVYTRGNNPTVEILRKKIAALEGTEEALIFSSGAAAISVALLSQLKSGDHLICVKNPYVWTRKTIEIFLDRYNISYSYVDGTNTAAIISGKQHNTKCILLESPNSLTFDIQNLEAISEFARQNDIVTIIDNSYASPLYQKPAGLGIDIVVHSATKYLNGHGDVLAGVICASEQIIRKIYKEDYMILGSIISPYEASLIIRGLRTLPIRMERSNQSALIIAKELESDHRIRKVLHPFLESHPQHKLAKLQMSGCGGLFSIELNTNDIKACEAFADSLEYFHMAASWGGYESLILPMCVFNEYLGGEAAGAPPFQLVRLYIGLEDPDFLLKDLRQALDKVWPL